jgi:hypothetical protein
MERVDREQWDTLWRGICELSAFFPEGIVFIGGVAVYLHVRGSKVPDAWVEFSHDGDFYISLADFADLRDLEEVTQNRRLSKYQLIKNGIEFDVYLEFRHTLRVPYAAAHAASSVIENVRVACLEHLMLLKLDAYADRRGSAKGRKDERDLIRIAYLLSQQRTIHRDRLTPLLTPQDVEAMSSVSRSTEIATMTDSAKHAAKLRSEIMKVVRTLRTVVQS